MTDPYFDARRKREQHAASKCTEAHYAGPEDEERFDLYQVRFGKEIGPHEHAHQFLAEFPVGLLEQRVVKLPSAAFCDEIRVALRAQMIGKNLPSHTVTRSRVFSVDLFDSPWQHFKANHAETWWLRWLVRRHPPTTHPVSREMTLTVTWDQFVGFPWQTVVSHLDRHADRFGPAIRFASVHDGTRVNPVL